MSPNNARIPFMPPLNSLWVFKHDFVMPHSLVTGYDNGPVFGVSLGDWPPFKEHDWGKDQWDWTPELTAAHEAWVKEQLEKFGGVIPAGTVVSFNRYHASNSGNVNMTLQFYRSPCPYLTPKKRGGKGKGPMRFYIDLDEFNSLGEMEPFDEQAQP